jgi:hypothetical protein
MRTVSWNPASLGKVKLSETYLATSISSGNYNLVQKTKYKEIGDTFKVSGGTTAAGEYGIFFRSLSSIGSSGITTKEIEIASHLNYSAVGTGVDFSSALKVNDWITVGFLARSPLEASINLAGDFPLVSRANTNLYGQTLDKMQILSGGKLKYTFTSGSTVTTYESTKPIWDGFLSQKATLALTTYSEFRNSINVQTPYSGAIAANLGGFHLGSSLTPINASANFDNDLHVTVNADASDIFVYTPNFDSSNQTEVAKWINDPDQYGNAAGYVRKQIRLPSGQIVASSKYRGFYSASAARLDLGMIYDLNDWFSIGFAAENAGGASLNFKGSDLANYISYREIDTKEANSLTDLLNPGGKRTIDLITDRWVSTSEISGTRLYLEPQKTYQLPKRMRYGFALKKPFLIVVDFEQNQNTIPWPGSAEVSIANLSLLRIGLESSLFNLPFQTRFGFTFMLKPTLTGASPSLKDSIDKTFKYLVLPLRVDVGTILNLWGYEVGDSLGFNFMPLLGLVQFDPNNLDLSRMLYYSLTIGKDAWQITYNSQLDALASASSYSNKSVPAGSKKQLEYSDAKFVQTLGITYRF